MSLLFKDKQKMSRMVLWDYHETPYTMTTATLMDMPIL